MAKRTYRTGSIEERNGTFRLRWSVDGRKFTKTLKAGTSKTDAGKELRKRLGAADNGQHVAPSNMTVNQWLDQWLSIGAPGKRKEPVGLRTLERYTQLLAEHVRPTLGDRP